MERISLNEIFAKGRAAMSNPDTPERDAQFAAKAEADKKARADWATSHPGLPFPDDVLTAPDVEDDDEEDEE